MSENCNLCPNNCNADRDKFVGKCGEKNVMRIAKYYLHPYEEPFISGKNGSGGIFFSGCSLKCVFCQNYQLSRSERGKEITPSDLSEIFKEHENAGATNINLVSPSHFVPLIYEAIKIRRPNIPVVYNSHGYENKNTLDITDKFVDIYLPDLKFMSEQIANRYTLTKNYFEVASSAILFMMKSRKTTIENGILQSGVCVRHLILPLCSDDSVNIINWFAKNRQNDAYFSLMAQYTPFGDIDKFPELQRKITKREYDKVLTALFNSGITDCYVQERSSSGEQFIPKWDF